MTQYRRNLMVGLALVALSLTPAMDAKGKDKARAKAAEVFELRVFRPGGSANPMSTVTVTINEWTTLAERQELMDTLQENGNKALSKALKELDFGFALEGGKRSWKITYAIAIYTQKGRLIRLLAERPMVIGEAARAARDEYSAFGYAEFTYDEKTGEGEGTIVPIAQPDLQKDGHFRILSLGDKPYKITEIEKKH